MTKRKNEILIETASASGETVQIDEVAGVIYGVKILGCESKNGRIYPNETLRAAVPLYEEAKVNLDHPDGDPRMSRRYQNRFGVIRNVQLREDAGLFADFWFNPKHAVAEQLLWDARHCPHNVGFSHNVEAAVNHSATPEIVEQIVRVRSVDLVADPATTQGLFESCESKTITAEGQPSPAVSSLTKNEVERLIEEHLSQFASQITSQITSQMVQRLREQKPMSRERQIGDAAFDRQAFAKALMGR